MGAASEADHGNLTSCTDAFLTSVHNNDFGAEETFAFTVVIDGQVRLRIEAINGCDRHDAGRVRNRGGREGAPGIPRRIGQRDQLRDRREHRTAPTQRGRNYVVHYTIVIPEDLELEINNVNGGVTIREIDGSVSVANVNGQVRLDDVEGDASVVVVNGQIDAEARTVAGTLDLATTNGAIELDVRTNVSATFDAAVVNGTITVSNLTLSNPVQTTNSLRGTFGGGQGPAS